MKIDLLVEALSSFMECAEEATVLDRQMGDGDLGRTVRRGTEAAMTAAVDLDSSASLADVISVCGKAFSRGNPSSFAALVGFGTKAAAAAIRDYQSTVSPVIATPRQIAIVGLEAFNSEVSSRGGAKVGDRTVLDASHAALLALRDLDGPEDPGLWMTALADGATRGAVATIGMVARRGRAAWVGDSNADSKDAGAFVFESFMTTLKSIFSGGDSTS